MGRGWGQFDEGAEEGDGAVHEGGEEEAASRRLGVGGSLGFNFQVLELDLATQRFRTPDQPAGDGISIKPVKVVLAEFPT